MLQEDQTVMTTVPFSGSSAPDSGASAPDTNLPPMLLDRPDDGGGLDIEEGVEAAVEPMPAANSGELEAVREILLGGAVKAIRRDLHLTVRNLRGTIKRVQHEFTQQTESFSQELASLRQRVDESEQARLDIVESVDARLEQTGEALAIRLKDQSEALDVAVRQIHADIELEANKQAHALEALDAKLLAALSEQAEEFRKGKMNRSEFADALASLAGQVSQKDD